MNREATLPPLLHRRGALILVSVILLLVGWWGHGLVLREFVLRLVPWVAESAGYTVRLGEVRATLFSPIVMSGVEVSGATGTRLAIRDAQLEWAHPSAWSWTPATWIRRLSLRGVGGEVVVGQAVSPDKEGGALAAAPRALWRWPRVVEVTDASLKISGAGWSLDSQGLELLLDEDNIGNLRLAAIRVDAGGHIREFFDLSAVAAWRDGVAYFADLRVDENVTFDNLSVALSGPFVLTAEARACGGYVYADWSADEATGTKAALHALNISLPGAAAFAGLEDDMAGTVDLAKLTFNGDPARPLSGQISLRIEAKDFAWRKNAVEDLTVGLSLAGRRMRLNECRLQQKGNKVMVRGTVTVPPDAATWREAPFDFDVDAEVGNLRALAGLFGAPWNELSGGLRIEGKGSGKAADGAGWLKVRGWDLAARGVPPGSLQADIKLEGRDLKLTGLDAQSGPNFLRGGGQLTLGEPLSYQGRLEMRVREVARYLEPLGRFAPDWAREGGVLLFWDGDGTGAAHSGVATLELVRFTGDLNPVPVNGKFSATYSPGNIYVGRFLLDRGPLSLSSTMYFGAKGLSVQDIEMFSGRSRLLRGELFLPLSLEAVLARRPWEQTVMRERDVYAFVRSDNLDLAALVGLFGQETTLRGRAELELDASGPWENAVIDGRVSANGFGAVFPAWRIPDSRAHAALQVKDRQASIGAHLQPEGSAALTWQANLPLIGETPEGGWRLVDRDKPWSWQLDVPPFNLAEFAPTLGGLTLARGLMRGRLTGSGTPSAPRVDGALEIKDGNIVLPQGWVALEDVQGKAVFSGTKAVLEETRARMGGGTLGVAGSMEFGEWRNAVWEILLRGEAVKIYEDDHLRLVASPDLEARGDNTAGQVKGSMDLSGTSVVGGLLVTPRLLVTENVAEPSSATAPFRVSQESFSRWGLDVKMSANAPLPVGREGVGGRLSPDLYLNGTLADPVLRGTVGVEALAVAFPSRAKMTTRGKVHFTSEKPWVPVLDLTGNGEAGPYDLRAGAFGPLERREMRLASSPPLTPEQMVLLLTTGVSPVPQAADLAPLTPEEKMQAEPAWLDLEKIRGLLGWGAPGADDGSGARETGGEVVGFEWGWR